MGENGQIGPLSETQLLDLADHSAISNQTLVWKVGMESWAPASSIPKIASRMQPAWTPPPVPTPPPAPTTSSAGGSQTSGKCPRDGTDLRLENRTGVEIDWCPSCRGVWLDKGELEKLMEREPNSRDPYQRDRYDDDDDDRKGRRRKGFLGDVFDIFD